MAESYNCQKMDKFKKKQLTKIPADWNFTLEKIQPLQLQLVSEWVQRVQRAGWGVPQIDPIGLSNVTSTTFLYSRCPSSLHHIWPQPRVCQHQDWWRCVFWMPRSFQSVDLQCDVEAQCEFTTLDMTLSPTGLRTMLIMRTHCRESFFLRMSLKEL